MTDSDAARFATLMAALGETFNETISDVRSDAYFAALADLSIAELEQAAHNHIRVGRYFPKPIELREWVTGTDDDQALTAWQQLTREVRRTGYTGRPDLPDTTIHAIERVWGSWVALCQTLPADGPGLSAWENRFRETYAVLLTRERVSLPPHPSRPQLASSAAPVVAGDTRSELGPGTSTSVPVVVGSRRTSGKRNGAT